MTNAEKFERGTTGRVDYVSERDFGKVVERDVALPFFREALKEVFSEAVHAPEMVDRHRGIDLILKLRNGAYLAIQLSIAESRDIWLRKAQTLLKEPYVEQLQEVYPDPSRLPRGDRVQRVFKVLVKLGQGPLYDAHRAFQLAGRKGNAVDFLPERDKVAMRLDVLQQIISCLSQFRGDFPKMRMSIEPQLQFLNQEALKLARHHAAGK